MYYGKQEHLRWQRTTTQSLVLLLAGLVLTQAAPGAWLWTATVAAAAASAVALLLARRAIAVPLLALLFGLLRGSIASPIPQGPPGVAPTNVAQVALGKRLATTVGMPESALAASLLVGARQSIPRDVVDDFRASGLAHLLAVSGYNVTLVANLLLSLGRRWLPRESATWLAVCGVAGFVWVAGASGAVVRAGLMGGLAAAVLHSGRATAAGRTLLVAAAAMATLDPTLVLGDVGFQLSFAATAAILVLTPRLLRWLGWLPDLLSVRTSLATTVAATLGTLPIVALTFGKVSLIGIGANVVAAPLVPPAMLFSTVAAAAAGTPLAPVAGYVASAVLRSLEGVAHLAASLPGAQLQW